MIFKGESLKGYKLDFKGDKLVQIDLPQIKESEQNASTGEKRKVGKWIYNRDTQNWECSECGEPPKTLGYVGTSAFMTEHFKFCNHCGTEMRGCENG